MAVRTQNVEMLHSVPDLRSRSCGLPRILYISQHWPHRARSASEIRAFYVRRALEQVGKVDVVVLDVEGGGEDWVAGHSDNYELVDVLKVHEHENLGICRKLRWSLDPRSHHPQGKSVGSEATKRVLQLAKKYDLIWFSKIRVASMFAHDVWPRSILDIDDIPSAFEGTVLRTDNGFLQVIMARLRRASWRRREKLLSERFTALTVCSEDDKQYLQNMGVDMPTYVVPNGFEHNGGEPVRSPSNPPRIGFTGIFDYYPNLEGIQWFVDNCWPLIKQQVPNARLRLAGRYSNGPLRLSGLDIDWLGWVEDLNAEIGTWSVMVVPILKGGGTRVKIALGFSRKCPIVSTSLGAYGYEVCSGDEIFLADTAEAFADACLGVIRQPNDAAEMAERAMQKFLEKWTWNAIAPRIRTAAENCLRRSANQPTRTT